MGKHHQFRRPPNRNGQFRSRKPQGLRQPFGYVHAMLLTLAVSIGGLIGMTAFQTMGAQAGAAAFQCTSIRILDGDTFDCDGQRIRLQGIDAPELPGHCRPGRDCTPGDPYASSANLSRLTAWQSVTCRKVDTDVYGRTVARCSAGKADLSCGQIDGGFAIRRYGMIWCDQG